MKDFIEKLIARLSKESDKWLDIWDKDRCDNYADGMNDAFDESIDIVRQLAEEYNNYNDFCEWEIKSWGLFPIMTSCENSLDVNYNYEFCPYCGKKIKITEYLN